ncbi:MAG TPA: metalloregulator ArsR/SmtB family transcription factor [Nitrososphaerales archaeon]|nr:metalloregulator ArsR/SmtB family transcription factor [Nitrososphaerales archaeon]
MSKQYYQAYVLVFKVLSNQVRLKLIEALRDGERDVGQLCSDIKEEQTRVSHELKCLTVCGFANYRRDGKRIIYSLNSKTVIPILDAASKHVEKFGERMEGCDMISDAKKITVAQIAK